MAQHIKNPSAMQETQETWVNPWVGKIPWRREMVTHSSVLSWKIPWTEEPGALPSIGSQRVRHDWVSTQDPFNKTRILNMNAFSLGVYRLPSLTSCPIRGLCNNLPAKWEPLSSLLLAYQAMWNSFLWVWYTAIIKYLDLCGCIIIHFLPKEYEHFSSYGKLWA